MKRTILLLATGLIVLQSYSQTQKGHWMLSASMASAGFSSNKSHTKYSDSPIEYNSAGKNLGVSVFPSALYFIKDNIALGGNFGASFSTSKTQNSNTTSPGVSKNKSHFTTFSFGPQIRCYFGESGSKGQPWVEANAGISTSPGKSDYSNTISMNSTENDSRSNNWNAGVNLGYSHFINSVIGFQYYVGYRHSHSSGGSDVTPSPGTPYSFKTTTDNNNINFGLGFQVHIPSSVAKNRNK